MGDSGRRTHVAKAFGAYLALAVLLLAAAPALAFPAEVLDSVVSVLPEWPSDEPLPERPEGSGTVVLPGGYIATNLHVLGRATVVSVRLNDGRTENAMEGVDAIRQGFGVRESNLNRMSRHVCNNALIDVQDEDNAVGCVYLTLYRHDGEAGRSLSPLRGPKVPSRIRQTQ